MTMVLRFGDPFASVPIVIVSTARVSIAIALLQKIALTHTSYGISKRKSSKSPPSLEQFVKFRSEPHCEHREIVPEEVSTVVSLNFEISLLREQCLEFNP
jgi:hypothetical protein